MLLLDVSFVVKHQCWEEGREDTENRGEATLPPYVSAHIVVDLCFIIYRLDHAVTATQKTILKAFGIDANYVKRKAREISGELNPKVLKVRI